MNVKNRMNVYYGLRTRRGTRGVKDLNTPDETKHVTKTCDTVNGKYRRGHFPLSKKTSGRHWTGSPGSLPRGT